MSIAEFDLPTKVSDALIDEFGEGQHSRYRGYFVSQSLREILKYVDADDIIELGAKRQTSTGHRDLLHVNGHGKEFLRVREERKADIRLHYDRSTHGPFDEATVLSVLDEEELLKDIPVSRLVYKFEHDELQEHLETLVENAMGIEPWWIRQPFYAVLGSASPGSDAIHSRVREHHDPSYFSHGEGGLGWKVRTLDLLELWTHRAWCSPNEVIASQGYRDSAEKYTAREVEEQLLNYQPDDGDPVFGATSSALLINRWRSQFGRGRTDLKAWVWEQSEGWVRTP